MVKSVFFYLDAVGFKFLDDMLFLKKLGKKGSLCNVAVEPLHQMEFCIFSSKPQKAINHWTWYYYNPDKSPYSWTKFLPNFLDNKYLKKAINYLTVLKEYIKGNTHIIPIGNIPLKFLRYFDFSSKKSFIDKNPCDIPTLFDVLRKEGISYYSYEWPIYSTESKTGFKITKKDDFSFLEQILKNKHKDFLFVHLTVFDGLLHQKGSKYQEIYRYLKELDKKIEIVCKILSKEDPNLLIFAASDHGMINVDKGVDVTKELNGLDIIYFLDSTCLRAWGCKKEIKKLKENLKKLPGEIYTKENKNKCPVDFKREYTGDILFIVNPGYEINPNFFNKELVKAMHGYNRTKELDAFLVSNKKITKRKRINNIDICPLILKALRIPIPKKWEGNEN